MLNPRAGNSESLTAYLSFRNWKGPLSLDSDERCDYTWSTYRGYAPDSLTCLPGVIITDAVLKPK